MLVQNRFGLVCIAGALLSTSVITTAATGSSNPPVVDRPAAGPSEPLTATLAGPGTGFVPLSPARLLDTRDGTGAPAGTVGPGEHLDVVVTGVGGVPDSGVGAVVLNVTVTGASEASWIAVWPTGQPRPLASSVNMAADQTIPNLVIAKVGADGKVSLYNDAGSTHLIADVAGYFAADQQGYAPLSPARLLDTRDGTGAPAGTVGPGEWIELDISGRAGVPAVGASAAVLNVTATSPSTASWMSVYPSGTYLPDASTLNAGADDTIANAVIVQIGAGGRVRLYNDVGTTHLIADVVGYFTRPGEVPVVVDAAVETLDPAWVRSVAGGPGEGGTVRLTADADYLVPGDIIVVDVGPRTPTGLMRRVIAVRTDSGGFELDTAPAALFEAIPQGEIGDDALVATRSTRQFRTSSVGQPLGTQAIKASPACSAGGTLDMVVDGSIDPSAQLSMAWDDRELDALDMVLGADLAFSTTTTASAKVSCERELDSFVIVTPPVTVPAGPVPVVLQFTVSLKLKLAGSVGGSLTGSASYGMQTTAGLVYRRDTGIAAVGGASSSATANWQPSASASVGLTLTPGLSVLLYGLVGPKAAVPLGVSADIDPCRSPLWRVRATVDAEVSIDFATFLKAVTAGPKATANLATIPLASGGSPLPNFLCDVAGTWDLDASGGGCSYTGNATFSQTGTKVTGEGTLTLTGGAADCPLVLAGIADGTLIDGQFTFGLAVGNGGSVDFQGSASGNGMSGGWTVTGGSPSGTWSATRSS
ncbi:hypothetical protein BH23ACT3_BH23ACT3_09130 [soil metagenome]